MRSKKLLAAFLLGVGLCFVPVLAYGEVRYSVYETKALSMDYQLLKARVDYIMRNPTTFLEVDFYFDRYGAFRKVLKLPEDINTELKIIADVSDNRNKFSYKSGIALRNEFKKSLEVIYSFIQLVATDMDTDIVAIFGNKERIPLGYFYEGEYHLCGGKK